MFIYPLNHGLAQDESQRFLEETATATTGGNHTNDIHIV